MRDNAILEQARQLAIHFEKASTIEKKVTFFNLLTPLLAVAHEVNGGGLSDEVRIELLQIEKSTVL